MEGMLISRNDAGTVFYSVLGVPYLTDQIADRTYSPCRRPKALSLGVSLCISHHLLHVQCTAKCNQTEQKKTKIIEECGTHKTQLHVSPVTVTTVNNHPNGRYPSGTVPIPSRQHWHLAVTVSCPLASTVLGLPIADQPIHKFPTRQAALTSAVSLKFLQSV